MCIFCFIAVQFSTISYQRITFLKISLKTVAMPDRFRWKLNRSEKTFFLHTNTYIKCYYCLFVFIILSVRNWYLFTFLCYFFSIIKFVGNAYVRWKKKTKTKNIFCYKGYNNRHIKCFDELNKNIFWKF